MLKSSRAASFVAAVSFCFGFLRVWLQKKRLKRIGKAPSPNHETLSTVWSRFFLGGGRNAPDIVRNPSTECQKVELRTFASAVQSAALGPMGAKLNPEP